MIRKAQLQCERQSEVTCLLRDQVAQVLSRRICRDAARKHFISWHFVVICHRIVICGMFLLTRRLNSELLVKGIACWSYFVFQKRVLKNLFDKVKKCRLRRGLKKWTQLHTSYQFMRLQDMQDSRSYMKSIGRSIPADLPSDYAEIMYESRHAALTSCMSLHAKDPCHMHITVGELVQP